MTPTETIEMMREQFVEDGIYVTGVRYDKFNDTYEVTLGDSELTFDLLQKVSKSLNTRNINVVSEVESGYYGEVSGNIRLDVKLTGERTNG